tara:strand:- start:2336 stop:2551 length:216 start_codon:yes stop_codon:yes gene_type:complete
MSRLIRVEGHSNLARDKHSGAIININANEMTAARERKFRWKTQQKEIQDLKGEVAEMKELIKQMVEANGRN